MPLSAVSIALGVISPGTYVRTMPFASMNTCSGKKSPAPRSKGERRRPPDGSSLWPIAPNVLLAALDLQPVGPDVVSRVDARHGTPRVFGGLVVAQALVAVSRTVEARGATFPPRLFHPAGRSRRADHLPGRAGARRGAASPPAAAWPEQADRPIFDLVASFQGEEGGLDHQAAMPRACPIPTPSRPARRSRRAPGTTCRRASAPGSARSRRSRCGPARWNATPPPRARSRRRTSGCGPRATFLPDDPAVHRAVLAYLSDLTLIDVALGAHGRTLFGSEFAVASLDHALWFHRPARVDDWLLYAQGQSQHRQQPRPRARAAFRAGRAARRLRGAGRPDPPIRPVKASDLPSDAAAALCSPLSSQGARARTRHPCERGWALPRHPIPRGAGRAPAPCAWIPGSRRWASPGMTVGDLDQISDALGGDRRRRTASFSPRPRSSHSVPRRRGKVDAAPAGPALPPA